MLKLRRLQIIKFRDFAPVTLHFHDRWNILLGRNGSGKTTILNLISMIVRDDLSALAGEEFEIEFELALDFGSCVAHIKNAVAAEEPIEGLPHPIDLGPSPPKPSAEVVLVDAASGRTATVRGDEQVSFVSRDDGSAPRFHGSLLGRGYLMFCIVVAIGVETRLSRNALRLDESLEFFRQIHARESTMQVRQVNHSSTSVSGFCPTPAIDRLQRASTAGPDRITFRGDELDLLDRFASEAGFRTAQLRIEQTGKDFDESTGAEITKWGNVTLYCTQPDGRGFIQRDLSYGQQRLWTFLYYLECNPDVVIADELVNGLHHQWIQTCLREIGERQAFLTSQNPLLFDFLEFSSADDVKAQFVLCSIDESQPNRPRRVRQMSDEKAAEFFAAYQVGVQQVSEILLTEGLWLRACDAFVAALAQAAGGI